MISHLLIFVIVLLCPPIIYAADPANKLTDHLLLSCGFIFPEVNSTDDGQTWIGDATTNLSPDMNETAISTWAFASDDVPYPYFTARIIHSRFSYIFPVSAGQKILRLYFYPNTTYFSLNSTQAPFNATTSFFDVTANRYTLLSTFSPFAAAKGGKYLVKEYIINVRQSESLNVTFVPSPVSSAFINGIEIVSVPEDLYMGLETNAALETMNRVTMGGPAVARVDDTGMFREWVQDSDFLDLVDGDKGNPISNLSISLTYTPGTPKYSAPAVVYKTARATGWMASPKPLTWNFEVDTGYVYILRLHFCEIMPSLISQGGSHQFTIFIAGMNAGDVDIMHLTGGTGIPMFRNYSISLVIPGGGRSKHDLKLALSPDRQAFVNGLEVFKLSTTDGYLAGVNP